MVIYSTGSFVNIFSMRKKHKYVIGEQDYNPESSLVDREDEQTIYCCFTRR